MVEALVTLFAGRLATAMLGPLGSLLKKRVLGTADQRALRRATKEATRRLAISLPDDLDQSTYIVDWLTDPDVAATLVDAAFADTEPDRGALGDRLDELGYDAGTSPIDLVAEAANLSELIRDQIRQEAEGSGAALFNRLVLNKLDRLGEVGEPQTVDDSRLPPHPELFVGREADIVELRTRLCPAEPEREQGRMRVMVVRGWPGVGKSTLAAAFAHRALSNGWFSDGVLWAALSEARDVRGQLDLWCRQLGLPPLRPTDSEEDVSRLLAGRLRDSSTLLVIDDAWHAEDASAFLVGGERCSALVTTRVTEVAQHLDPRHYPLPVLSDDAALELMDRLAPHVVKGHREEMLVLVRELEGLPLALRVAARLLASEQRNGWGITELIHELREGAALLAAQAPADRADLANGTTPTIEALFARSTDLLPPPARMRFAALGAFAQRPATFDLSAVAAVWDVPDARPDVRLLISRGLLEPVANLRFQLHGLLAVHARTLLSTG
ncbi:NB-ARC domain-containing protein [Streptomyces sp. NBC_01092]|uniref:NB-ARC domain-containing protein n=1 Tax=Streptomyces sp. NBC_01092 TaxID=2903748 RepID=UPI00386F9D04|nr:NB-ARC domain-containing protein [Streptomyces sp. NBC_01092]